MLNAFEGKPQGLSPIVFLLFSGKPGNRGEAGGYADGG